MMPVTPAPRAHRNKHPLDYGNRRKWEALRTFNKGDRIGVPFTVKARPWASEANVSEGAIEAALEVWKANGVLEYAVTKSYPKTFEVTLLLGRPGSDDLKTHLTEEQRARMKAANERARERRNGAPTPPVAPVTPQPKSIVYPVHDLIAALQELVSREPKCEHDPLDIARGRAAVAWMTAHGFDVDKVV